MQVGAAQKSFEEQLAYGAATKKERREGLRAFSKSDKLMRKAKAHCADPANAKDAEDKARMKKLVQALKHFLAAIGQLLGRLVGRGRKGPDAESEAAQEAGPSGPSGP